MFRHFNSKQTVYRTFKRRYTQHISTYLFLTQCVQQPNHIITHYKYIAVHDKHAVVCKKIGLHIYPNYLMRYHYTN